MNDPIVCPFCRITVIPMDDNSCPSCQKNLNDKEEVKNTIDTLKMAPLSKDEIKKAKKLIADRDSVFFFLPFIAILAILACPISFLFNNAIQYLVFANGLFCLLGLIQLFRWHSSSSYLFLIGGGLLVLYNFPYGIIGTIFQVLFSFDSVRVLKHSKIEIEELRRKVVEYEDERKKG